MIHYAFICYSKDDSEQTIQARCHYTQALVDGRTLYNIYDDAHVKVSVNLNCFVIFCMITVLDC
jgi:hypothetical protein